MFLWLFVAVLAAIFVVLAAYTFPYAHGHLQPGSEFLLGLTTQIGAMMVEVVAIVKLSAYFADRKWQPVRDQIRDVIWADFMNILSSVSFWSDYHKAQANHYTPPQNEMTKEGYRIVKPTPAGDLNRILSDTGTITAYLEANNARENMQFMAAGFTPELASQIGSYLTNRDRLKYYTSKLMKLASTMIGDSQLTDLRDDNQRLVADKLTLLVAREDSKFARYCKVGPSISANSVEEAWDLIDTLNGIVRAATAIDSNLANDYRVRNYTQYFFDHADYLHHRGKQIREELNSRRVDRAGVS